jgi:hypothetical protein
MIILQIEKKIVNIVIKNNVIKNNVIKIKIKQILQQLDFL